LGSRAGLRFGVDVARKFSVLQERWRDSGGYQRGRYVRTCADALSDQVLETSAREGKKFLGGFGNRG
jgi:hypothetical protein